MATYIYQKKCSDCGTVYFTNSITEDQFCNIQDNPSIEIAFKDNIYSATITSLCNNCAAIVKQNFY